MGHERQPDGVADRVNWPLVDSSIRTGRFTNLFFLLDGDPRIASLTWQDNVALLGRAQKGDEQARTALIMVNARLVFLMSGRSAAHFGAPHLFDAFFQAGLISLNNAIDKFKRRRGTKFSAYLGPAVERAFGEVLVEENGPITLPKHLVLEWSGQLSRAEAQLTQKLGRRPKIGELAQEVGWSADKAQRVKDAPRGVFSLQAKVKSPYGDGEGTELEEEIAADNGFDPQRAAEIEAVHEQLEGILDELPPKEAEVIRLRFLAEAPVEEVVAELGVTQQGVKNREIKALQRCRHPSRLRRLADFRDGL